MGCTKVRDNEIDFSFESGWDNEWAFSIKVEKSGKAFLARNRSNKKYFQRQLDESDLKVLDSYIDTLSNNSFEHDYEDDVVDSGTFYIIINSKNKEKGVKVYGHTAPQELYRFSDFLKKFRDDSTFIAIDSTIFYKSASEVWKLPYPIKPLNKQ